MKIRGRTECWKVLEKGNGVQTEKNFQQREGGEWKRNKNFWADGKGGRNLA